MTVESEARRLRAAIYGDITDSEWRMLIPIWTQPYNLRWLREHQTPPFCPVGMHWKKWNQHADEPEGLG